MHVPARVRADASAGRFPGQGSSADVRAVLGPGQRPRQFEFSYGFLWGVRLSERRSGMRRIDEACWLYMHAEASRSKAERVDAYARTTHTRLHTHTLVLHGSSKYRNKYTAYAVRDSLLG